MSNSSISVVKSEGQTLISKLDKANDEFSAIESLYSLCLFEKNRQALLDLNILSHLVLALKTKSDPVKGYTARTLQLFAQDGGDTIIQLKRFNICNSCLEICAKTDDEQVLIPLAGLLYWLAQNPACKKELQDLDASSILSDLKRKSNNPLFVKYINYVVHALRDDVKSREEILDDIVSGKSMALVGAKSQVERFEVTSPSEYKSFDSSSQSSTTAQ